MVIQGDSNHIVLPTKFIPVKRIKRIRESTKVIFDKLNTDRDVKETNVYHICSLRNMKKEDFLSHTSEKNTYTIIHLMSKRKIEVIN